MKGHIGLDKPRDCFRMCIGEKTGHDSCSSGYGESKQSSEPESYQEAHQSEWRVGSKPGPFRSHHYLYALLILVGPHCDDARGTPKSFPVHGVGPDVPIDALLEN